MSTTNTFTPIVDSESFGRKTNHYFIDLKKTKDNRPFLSITQSKAKDDSFVRHQVIIFESDLHFFMEALTMLIGRFSAGETQIN